MGPAATARALLDALDEWMGPAATARAVLDALNELMGPATTARAVLDVLDEFSIFISRRVRRNTRPSAKRTT
jgi:hypothetical protein